MIIGPPSSVFRLPSLPRPSGMPFHLSTTRLTRMPAARLQAQHSQCEIADQHSDFGWKRIRGIQVGQELAEGCPVLTFVFHASPLKSVLLPGALESYSFAPQHPRAHRR